MNDFFMQQLKDGLSKDLGIVIFKSWGLAAVFLQQIKNEKKCDMIRRGDYCHVPRKINKESKTA